MQSHTSNLRGTPVSIGSVAERIMIFEKRPMKILSNDPESQNMRKLVRGRSQNQNLVIKTPLKTQVQTCTTKCNSDTSKTEKYIPRFFFRHGNLAATIASEKIVRSILTVFDSYPNNQISLNEMPRLLKICQIPFYWRRPLLRCTEQRTVGLIERQKFIEFWKQINVYCHDDASKFVYIISRGQRTRPYILPEDLESLIQDVVETHPGLSFLKQATEFHSKYVQTVIARIFYSVNRSWSGKITAIELRNSNLLEIIQLLEVEDDINQIMAYFSYEHFYVIYCKFWELDTDHDFYLKKEDLERYENYALSLRIIDRIFSECVSHRSHDKNWVIKNRMTYSDFVWFLLSEQDKKSPMSIEYWFRCLDIDGDGYLSMYELEYFYEEQQQRMDTMGIEILPFEDCLCQMLDLIKPKHPEFIMLGDLKKCKLADIFFDTFFNLEKCLQHEQVDPLYSDCSGDETCWDRYAAAEYEMLISEENHTE